ncbi:MAG: hypothetical protein ACUZ8H_01620 [Candidatus Anammoxibacter sp.]
MSKLVAMKLDNFSLKKARIFDGSIECHFEENKIVNEEPRVVQHTTKAPYIPHPDLLEFRDDLKPFLMQSLCMTDQYEHDIKYLKAGQKKSATDQHKAYCNKVVVTGITISGEDQLRGAIITGKVKNRMDGYSALNSPRVIFSSEKLGFESKVQNLVGLIEIEIFKCIFENKSSQETLFNNDAESIAS